MLETGVLLDLMRLIVGVIILGYASYTDIRTRRASNILWLIMGSIGGVLLVVQFFTVDFEDIRFLLSIPVMIGFFYVLFQLRLIFGGADAKALMALAILVPLQPVINGFPLYGALPVFIWSIFSNSVVLFLLIPLSLLIFNLARRDVEFPYCILGYKMSVEKALQKFVWPLEKIEEGKRKFMYMPSEFDAEEEILELQKHGLEEIWVTPKIPFMIPLLAGFICAFILGDLLFYLMNTII